MNQVLTADDLFASFDIEELDVLEVTDGIALPQMGASVMISIVEALCCSSSSSTCCC